MLWNVPGGRERAVLKGHSDTITSIAISADGKTLASGDLFGVVRVWDLATAKERATVRGPEHGVTCVAISPDGNTLAVAGSHGSVHLCDLATGKIRNRVDLSVATVNSAAFAPDGKTLACGADDGTVTLWDVTTLTGWTQSAVERVKRRFRSRYYTVTWGSPTTFVSDAELEIGGGYGHGGSLDWLRFRPGKDRVDVLTIQFDEGWHPYKSKWPPDRAPVTVEHAVMQTDAYAALLRDLAIVDSATLKPADDLAAGFSSGDFWVQARLVADKKALLDLEWAGYAVPQDEVKYAKAKAAVDVARVAVHWLNFQPHTLTDEERAWLSAKFVRDWKKFKDEEFHWWVRERYIETIGVVGDKTVLPSLRDILASAPPKAGKRDPSDERCVYLAINAATRLTKTDVRDKPVEEMDIEKMRRKVLDMLRATGNRPR
jgi:hypothetical protein